MVAAKEALLKAALGIDALPIQQEGDRLRFPWFRVEDFTEDAERLSSVTLVSLMCSTAKAKKRVTAKEKALPENPKYAMRCFLLSIGMIGKEHAPARKTLLSKLDGNSAWRNGPPLGAQVPAETVATTADSAETPASAETTAKADIKETRCA